MMVCGDSEQDANRETFRPGVATWIGGIYLICHSSRHRPDAKCFLPKGLMLPHCPTPGCEVTFRLVQPCPRVSEKRHFDPP